jgi:CDP-glycerol glycerophosphotransferase
MGDAMRIVYNSFHGRYSCNPRALYERLVGRPATEHVWLADPAHQVAFPEEVTTVDINGKDAARALESADLVIANTHTEVEWDKPSDARYLQTWHGTPLKRIHNDVLWAPEGRLRRLDRDIAKWDVLLSPNAVSTPRLSKAFGFDLRILETGYPRNDCLSGADAAATGQLVRQRLGIEPATTVVLYAPTWRDDEAFVEGLPDIPLALDLPAYLAALGPDHVLLVREHNMVTGRSHLHEVPGVLDVSLYPDVRDLYLAADVLVTDYSSVMFDFAVTGKPMIFFAYDLERFADSVRGFYFDFTASAPGPVVRTTAEVTQALLDLPTVQETHAARYQVFRAAYCALEDGRSTQRVVDLLRL